MTITIDCAATPKEVANAADVLNNICNGRRSMRQSDKDAGRIPTGYEDDVFNGLTLAAALLKRVHQEVNRAS